MSQHRFFEPCSMFTTPVEIITLATNCWMVLELSALAHHKCKYISQETHLCKAFTLVKDNTLDCHSLSSSSGVITQTCRQGVRGGLYEPSF